MTFVTDHPAGRLVDAPARTRRIWRLPAALRGGTGSRGLSYAFALGCGLFLAFTLIPLDLLLTGVPPDTRLPGDIGEYAAAQRAFLADGWHWPLLRTTLFDSPGGVSIALMDAIPLIVLPLKPFAHWLPRGFTPIYFWLALTYLLQPVAATFALRGAGEKRLVPAISAASLSIAVPTLLFRHGHIPLCSHFVVLAALGGYFRLVRGARFGRAILLALPPISLLINTYIMIMALAVLAAAPLSLALRGRARAIPLAATLAVAVILTGAIAAVLDYGGITPTGGFGEASMNLFSPLWPAYSGLIHPELQALDATGAQLEGYQYLGAGLIALILVAAVTAAFSTRTGFLRNHLGLAAACLVLTALALSNKVYAGHHLIIDLGPVPSFFQQLRSSGRLFWPVTYTCLIGSVAVVARLLPAPASAAILLAAAALQVLDARHLDHGVTGSLRSPSAPLPDRLDRLIAAHKRLTILPTYGCGTNSDTFPLIQLMLAASRLAVPVNTAYVARFPKLPVCRDWTAAASPLAPDELRVFLEKDAAAGPLLVPDGTDACRGIGALAVCSRQRALLDGLPRPTVPTTPLSVDIDAGGGGPVLALGPGWSGREGPGVWTDEPDAALAIDFGQPPAGDIRLTARFYAYVGDTGRTQAVTVIFNGEPVGTWRMANLAGGVFNVTLPKDRFVAGPQSLRFEIALPTRPWDVSDVHDIRELGIFLEMLRFDQE